MEALARLRNFGHPPRKTRLLADLVRGERADRALAILKFSKQAVAKPMEKLLLSAIANWKSKNEGVRFEGSELYVKAIFVDAGVTLKRRLAAPHGRAYPMRKRSNHITMVIDKIGMVETQEQPEDESVEVVAETPNQASDPAETK